MSKQSDGTFAIDLKKGGEVILYAEGVSVADIEPVPAERENFNTFGMNERPATPAE